MHQVANPLRVALEHFIDNHPGGKVVFGFTPYGVKKPATWTTSRLSTNYMLFASLLSKMGSDALCDYVACEDTLYVDYARIF